MIDNKIKIIKRIKNFIIAIIFIFSYLTLNVFAIEEFQDSDIEEYKVLEIKRNYVPLRLNPDENSKRIVELSKGTKLYAIKQTDNYYLVELNNENNYYINKKYVIDKGLAKEKSLGSIKKINVLDKKDRYVLDIKSNKIPPYILKEENKDIKITFFDNHFDPTEIDIENEAKNIKISNLIANEFDILYENDNIDKPFFGYDVIKKDDGYRIVIKKLPKINLKKPLKGMKIMVDPGHGGIDSGARYYNLKEKDLNLQISKKLKKELKKSGAKVYMTRKKDKTVNLYDRTKYALDKDVDISLSIHQNSLANIKNVDKKHGTGVYYYHSQSEPLARSIQDSMLEKTQFKDDKIHNASFVMTRMSLPVSVLVECGYIIHREEATKLADKNFQYVVARAIKDGVKNYLLDNYGIYY